MIEKIIYDYLNANLSSRCYMERPQDKPEDPYVLLEKTGSFRENRITTSTFAVQSYAATVYDAAALNEVVKDAMDQLVSLDEIGAVYLQTDYNFTDPATKQPRYQAVFNITHY